MTTQNAKAIPYQGELKMALIVAIGYYFMVSLFQLKSGLLASWFITLLLCVLFGFTAWRTWYTRTVLGWGLSQWNAVYTIICILVVGVLSGIESGLTKESVIKWVVWQFSLVFIPISWLLKKPVGAVSDRLMEIVDFTVIGVLYAVFGSWGVFAFWSQVATVVPSLSFLFAAAGIAMIAGSRTIVRLGTKYEPFYKGASWCAFAKPVFLTALVPFSFFLRPALAGEGILALTGPLGVSLLTTAVSILSSAFVVPFAFAWYRLERRKAESGDEDF